MEQRKQDMETREKFENVYMFRIFVDENNVLAR